VVVTRVTTTSGFNHMKSEPGFNNMKSGSSEVPDTQYEERRILGTTPFTLQLDRKPEQTVEFSKEGYKTLTMKLTSSVNPAFFGNILIGGLFGSTTDALSGAIYKYDQDLYFVALVPETGSALEHATLLSSREKVRQFMVHNYPSLLADLSKGSGEALSAVMELLHIGKDQVTDARRKIQALSQVYTDPAVFANHVSDLYLK
jgi:hypothetical protein